MKRGIATPEGEPTKQVRLSAQEEEEVKTEWKLAAIHLEEKMAKEKKDQLNYSNAIDKVCKTSLMTAEEVAIFCSRLK